MERALRINKAQEWDSESERESERAFGREGGDRGEKYRGEGVFLSAMDLDGDENRATDNLLLSYGNNRQREEWTTVTFCNTPTLY